MIAPFTEESEVKLVILATSKNFSTKETCKIELINHIIGEPGDKSFHETNFPDEIDWIDS